MEVNPEAHYLCTSVFSTRYTFSKGSYIQYIWISHYRKHDCLYKKKNSALSILKRVSKSANRDFEKYTWSRIVVIYYVHKSEPLLLFTMTTSFSHGGRLTFSTAHPGVRLDRDSTRWYCVTRSTSAGRVLNIIYYYTERNSLIYILWLGTVGSVYGLYVFV